ncbi:hypothetical protein KCP69_23690 [Salmonella enterica subsp. enterica]|nr:hypothetical protein KCP69_23690 [Salmonella enterica subsp. enterica]
MARRLIRRCRLVSAAGRSGSPHRRRALRDLLICLSARRPAVAPGSSLIGCKTAVTAACPAPAC